MNTAKVNYTKQSKTSSKDETLSSDVFIYGRKVGGVTVTQVQPLTYRALQTVCKTAGISAKGSANDLRKRLWLHEHSERVPNEVPLTKRQKALQTQAQDVSQDVSSQEVSFDFESDYAMDTSMSYQVPDEVSEPKPATKPVKAPRPKTIAKLSSIGLSYRDSQRFVSWWRSEDRLTMPCKNTGWANVEANIEHILNDARFWGWASTEHGKAKLAAMGVSI